MRKMNNSRQVSEDKKKTNIHRWSFSKLQHTSSIYFLFFLKAAKPSKPEPISKNVPGSGTGADAGVTPMTISALNVWKS